MFCPSRPSTGWIARGWIILYIQCCKYGAGRREVFVCSQGCGGAGMRTGSCCQLPLFLPGCLSGCGTTGGGRRWWQEKCQQLLWWGRRDPAKAGAAPSPAAPDCCRIPALPVLQLTAPSALREHEELQLGDNVQNRPRAPSWLPKTLLWVILAIQIPLWAAAEVGLEQNLPQPQKLELVQQVGFPQW